MRDVRDYRIHDGDNRIITGGSAFNIKSKSLRLGNFSRQDVATLYTQHTEATGQAFEAGVIDYVFEQTAGQPWLVNAVGYEACFESELLGGDIEPGLALPSEDDQLYVQDLGLIRTRPQAEIANPIYREIIPRTLTWITQTRIPQETAWYLGQDERLDFPKLLDAFQQFFRKNGELWIERFDYKEAGSQLLMQAFLQRIVNSGGRIDREYGLGRRRTDLLVQWPLDEDRSFHGPVQRVVIELKILHKSLETTITEGLAQTADYMDRVGTDEGYLVVFDRTPDVSWEEKRFVRQERHGKRRMRVWGM